MRIPFWTQAQAHRDPALVAAIEQRRGGRLLNLDRLLLWSEPLARSWNVFLRTLRQELSLAPKLRELAICVVARATGPIMSSTIMPPSSQKPAAAPRRLPR